MSIYLIRHGETAGNARRIMQIPETPLSERGIEQAQRLAARLADVGIERILASDHARARMTAEPLGEATGVSLDFDARLQERNFGDLRGTPYAEFDMDPFAEGYTPPGGESWEVFHRRVDAGWQVVAEKARGLAGHLAVVTHGLVCHSLVTRKLEVPEPTRAEIAGGELLRFGNTALTVIDAEPPHRVELLGCTAHLAGPADAREGGAA